MGVRREDTVKDIEDVKVDDGLSCLWEVREKAFL